MEADLQRYYRLDLRDLWRGGLTLRRVGVMVAGLPPESLTMSRVLPDLPDRDGGPERLWSVEAQLLATVVDAVQSATHAIVQSNAKHRVRPPRPLPRPGGREKRRRRLTPQQRAEIDRRNHGGEHGD